MALNVKKVGYFNIKIDSSADEAYNLLSIFAAGGVGLLAFKAVTAEDKRTQFSLFPNDIPKMKESATIAGLKLDGPYTAVMITSDSDEPGECAGIFKKLSHNNINILESSGIADIKDSYGVILYLNQEDCEKAILALKL
jgi:aspartokinase